MLEDYLNWCRHQCMNEWNFKLWKSKSETFKEFILIIFGIFRGYNSNWFAPTECAVLENIHAINVIEIEQVVFVCLEI